MINSAERGAEFRSQNAPSKLHLSILDDFRALRSFLSFCFTVKSFSPRRYGSLSTSRGNSFLRSSLEA
jgi:hypothetical protein